MDNPLPFVIFSGYLKLLWCYYQNGKRSPPKTAELVGHVSDLILYPVKSMRGVHLSQAEFTYRGLKYSGKDVFDRNFMLVDELGRYANARMDPKETTIAISVQGDHLVMEYPGMAQLKLPLKVTSEKPRIITAKVWGECVEGLDCGDEAAQWVSQCLSKPGCRLIYGAEKLLQRELNKQNDRWRKQAKDGDFVTYQDGFPFMLIGQASLDDLNSRHTSESFSMARFRPNLVVTGSTAFDEDTWSEIWIGNKAKLSFLKPCHRYRLDVPVFGKSPLLGILLVLDRYTGEEINVADPVYALRKPKDFF